MRVVMMAVMEVRLHYKRRVRAGIYPVKRFIEGFFEWSRSEFRANPAATSNAPFGACLFSTH
jgi:hypothetical protein